MKECFEIIVMTYNYTSRLLSRILILFNRQNIYITDISVKLKKNDISFYNIGLKCCSHQLKTLVENIKKIIDVMNVYFYKMK